MNVNNSTQGNETLARTWTHPVSVSTRITLYSILLVWSLLANVLVIVVVCYNQNLRTNMNYLIVNMAVSDLLIPLVAMPRKISGQWLVDGPLGDALCKLVAFFSHLLPFVSSISLVIIAFQRFMAVVYPHRGQLSGRKTRWIVISFPWLLSMAIFSPNLHIYRLSNEYGYLECDAFWTFRDLSVYSMTAAVGFAVPLIVIITLYIMIIYKLRRSLDNVRGMMEKEMIRSRQKRNKRIFGMLITIVVLFTICWCPLATFLFLSYHGHLYFWIHNHTWLKLLFAFLYIWYLQAAINPCIYFVFLKDFRQGLKSLCCRKITSAIEPIPRRPPLPGGDSNQDPTCTPPHINTTSV